MLNILNKIFEFGFIIPNSGNQENGLYDSVCYGFSYNENDELVFVFDEMWPSGINGNRSWFTKEFLVKEFLI